MPRLALFHQDGSPVELSDLGIATTLQQDVLATDKVTTEPLPISLMSGTFVPDQATVDVTINASIEVYGLSQAHLRFIYGNVTPTGELQQAGQYLPVKAGVGTVKLGKVAYDTVGGTMSRFVRLTGLTPGATYSYRLQATVTGGLQDYTVPADTTGTSHTPSDLVLLDSVAFPTYASKHKAYMRCYGTGKILVVEQPMTPLAFVFDRPYSMQECPKYLITGPASMAAAEGKLALSPDGSRLVNTAYWGNGVHIIDTALDTIVFASTSITGPFGVCFNGNSTAWVAGNNGSVYPVTIATGAVGSAFATGAAAGTGLLVGAGGIAFHANYGTSTLRRIDLAGGPAVTHTATPPGTVSCLYLSEDGTRVWVGMENEAGCKAYNASDLSAISGAVLTPPAVTDNAADVISFTENDSGTVAYVGHTDGRWDYYYIGAGGDGPRYSWFDGVDFGTAGIRGIGCTPIENIWVCEGENIHVYPGASINCRAVSWAHDEFAVIDFRGVA